MGSATILAFKVGTPRILPLHGQSVLQTLFRLSPCSKENAGQPPETIS